MLAMLEPCIAHVPAELYSRRGTLNPVLPWTFVLFNITLNSLNIYWFYKMVQSIAKRFKKDDGKKTEDGKKEE